MAVMWSERSVFVASTFLDFHAERDYLRQVVFPALAERLRVRRTHLAPIDLRWGVDTDGKDEEEKERQVLQVCFGEITRSQPLVLVLLGDRYGWQPDPITATRLGLDFPPRLSVTEMEVEHAIRTTQPGGRGPLIYIREPLDGPQSDPAGSPAAAALARLKDRLRAAYPDRVREYRAGWDAERGHVTGLENFGRTVEADLWEALEALEAANPGPLDSDEAETAAQTARAAEHLRVFCGRKELLERLVKLVATADGPPAVVVTGAAGAGKSGLMAALARLLADSTAGEQLFVLAHEAEASPCSTTVDDLLLRWGRQAARALGQPLPPAEVADPGRELGALLRTLGPDRRAVLLVDGLDRFRPASAACDPGWLLDLLPPGGRVVVSTGAAAGGWTKFPAVAIPPLDPKEAAAAVARRCQIDRRALSPAVLRELLAKPAEASGNPLWLEIAIGRLSQATAADFAAVDGPLYAALPADARITARLTDLVREMPADLTGMYQWLLHQIEQSVWHNLKADPRVVRSFALFLALTRGGLRDTDLAALTAAFDPIPSQFRPDVAARPLEQYPSLSLFSDPCAVAPTDPLTLAVARRAFGDHLTAPGADGRYRFAHQPMLEAVIRRYVNCAPYDEEYDGPHLLEWRLAEINQRSNHAFRAVLRERGLKPGRTAAVAHGVAARYLAALPDDDPCRRDALLAHLLRSDDSVGQACGRKLPSAAQWYADQTEPQSRRAAAAVLAELVLEDETLPLAPPAGTDRVVRLLGDAASHQPGQMHVYQRITRDVLPLLGWKTSEARLRFVKNAVVARLHDWMAAYRDAAEADPHPDSLGTYFLASQELGDGRLAWLTAADARAEYVAATRRGEGVLASATGLTPKDHMQLAILHARVGQTYWMEGDHAAAVDCYRRYVDFLRSASTVACEPCSASSHIAVGLLHFASVSFAAGRTAESSEALAEALGTITGIDPDRLNEQLLTDLDFATYKAMDVARAVGRDDLVAGFREAIARLARGADRRPDVHGVHGRRKVDEAYSDAVAAHASQNADEILAAWERVREACEKLCTADTADEWAQERLSDALNGIGQQLAATGRPTAAYPVLRRRLSVLDRLAELLPDPERQPDRATVAGSVRFVMPGNVLRARAMTHKRLMEISQMLGQADEAAAHFNEYCRYFRERRNAAPDDPLAAMDLSIVSVSLATLLEWYGMADDAAHQAFNGLTELLAVAPSLPDEHALLNDVAHSMLTAIQVLMRAGRTSGSAEWLDGVNRIRERLGQPPLR